MSNTNTNTANTSTLTSTDRREIRSMFSLRGTNWSFLKESCNRSRRQLEAMEERCKLLDEQGVPEVLFNDEKGYVPTEEAATKEREAHALVNRLLNVKSRKGNGYKILAPLWKARQSFWESEFGECLVSTRDVQDEWNEVKTCSYETRKEFFSENQHKWDARKEAWKVYEECGAKRSQYLLKDKGWQDAWEDLKKEAEFVENLVSAMGVWWLYYQIANSEMSEYLTYGEVDDKELFTFTREDELDSIFESQRLPEIAFEQEEADTDLIKGFTPVFYTSFTREQTFVDQEEEEAFWEAMGV